MASAPQASDGGGDAAPKATQQPTPGGRRHRHLSFRLKLFLQTLSLVIVVIAVMVAFMYHNESQLRSRIIRAQLAMVDRSIIYAYEQQVDLPSFLHFIDQYLEHSMFERMYVSVYDANDSLIASQGPPLNLDDYGLRVKQEWDDGNKQTRQALVAVHNHEQLYYYSTFKSNDGNITIVSAMPYTFSLRSATGVGAELWWITLGITLMAVAFVWLSTRQTGRNIRLLRNYAVKAASGETMPVDEQDLPHDELGEISRDIFRLYNQRIRAIDRSEREHRVALHAMEEKGRIKHRLTNNINHELKTPVGVIKGYLDTIADTPDMDPRTRAHFLERARANVDRLCSLLTDVSTMTRLEDGADNIPLADVNLHDLAYTVENDVLAGNLNNGMAITIDLPLDCTVRANESLMQGMLLNLVKNAVVHSHGTQIGLRLVSESEKFYVFSFWDNGVGVAAEHLPHLFERFYRVDSGRSRKAGGTGLGLPIIKKTVLAMGGAISVHNRSAGGLEYIFSLPKA